MIAVVTAAGTVRLVQQQDGSTTSSTVNEELNKPQNPILPETSEIIWAVIAFAILLFAMFKLLPTIKKGMDARTERIRTNLDDAERVKAEAQTILDEYQRQLADAKSEANRIIEEARQTAESLRRDLMARAEADVAELRQRSTEDIAAAQDRALSDLSSRVAELAIAAAEKVVEKSLDRDTNVQLVENFISSVGSTR